MIFSSKSANRGDGGTPKSAASHSSGVGRFLFWLFILIGIILLRWWSVRYADAFVFCTRAGNVQGLVSYRGQMLLAVSNLSLGPERSLTIERISESAGRFSGMYELIYDGVAGRKRVAGFGMAASKRGDLPGNAVHTVLAAPHWFFILLLLIPTLRAGLQVVRTRRRIRKGHCRHCGYDLRGAAGPCPECGGTNAAGPRTTGFLTGRTSIDALLAF